MITIETAHRLANKIAKRALCAGFSMNNTIEVINEYFDSKKFPFQVIITNNYIEVRTTSK